MSKYSRPFPSRRTYTPQEDVALKLLAGSDSFLPFSASLGPLLVDGLKRLERRGLARWVGGPFPGWELT